VSEPVECPVGCVFGFFLSSGGKGAWVIIGTI
jgi:hypothetical protein